MVQVLRHRDQMVLNVREVQSLFLVFVSAKRPSMREHGNTGSSERGEGGVGDEGRAGHLRCRISERRAIVRYLYGSQISTAHRYTGSLSTHIAWLDL